MLTALRTGLRFRLAILLSAIAVFCFIMPPAAVAFGHGERTAHCLTHADMIDHGVAKGASADKHAGRSTPDSTHQMNCCGLFCLSALPAEIGEVIGGISTGPALFLTSEPRLLSQSPERPDRPPNSLLFV